mgnify:CR=1 FL=1
MMLSSTHTGGGGVEHHAGLNAALLQMRERAVQVRGGLVVYGDHIGAGVCVPIDRLVGVRHHEVRVDRYIGGALDGLEDVNAKVRLPVKWPSMTSKCT